MKFRGTKVTYLGGGGGEREGRNKGRRETLAMWTVILMAPTFAVRSATMTTVGTRGEK